MGAVYATVDDVIANGHTVSDPAVMLTVLTEASAMLRTEVAKYGTNLDTLITSNADIGTNAKMVVITASERYIGTDASTSGMSQFSESALGYTVSGTIAGGGLYFTKNEIKKVIGDYGRQKYGVIDFYIGDTES